MDGFGEIVVMLVESSRKELDPDISRPPGNRLARLQKKAKSERLTSNLALVVMACTLRLSLSLSFALLPHVTGPDSRQRPYSNVRIPSLSTICST